MQLHKSRLKYDNKKQEGFSISVDSIISKTIKCILEVFLLRNNYGWSFVAVNLFSLLSFTYKHFILIF